MHESDPADRELCPDGRCVGVIGEDGRCGQCGLSRNAAPDEEPPPAAGPPSETEAEAEAPAAAADPDTRVLCWDERCVGIIGPNGHCGTCGRGDPE